MIKRELAKDPKLADQDWSRFLPKFGKRKAAKRTTAGTGANSIEVNPTASTSTSVPAASVSAAPTPFPAAAPKKEKKPYTPFPPAQTPRKIDLEMASGEYFLKPHEKKRRKLEERQEKADAVKVERTKQRLEQFVPPNESAGAGAGTAAHQQSDEQQGNREKKKRKREEGDAMGGDAKPAGERKKKFKKAVAIAEDA